MGARHGVITNRYLALKRDEMTGSCPEAECPLCGRTCKVYWPTGGDGSVRITFWHKKTPGGKWCRAEVDIEDVRNI